MKATIVCARLFYILLHIFILFQYFSLQKNLHIVFYFDLQGRQGAWTN